MRVNDIKFGTVSAGRYTGADRYTGVAVGRRSTVQLKLCAFALKGQYNVYSLVPNMPVCTYIDQKLIYIKLWSASSRFEHCSNHSRNFFGKCFIKNGCRHMSKNHFWSHLLPFQIDTTIFIFVIFFSSQNGHWRTFCMSENHFQSHFWPFQIDRSFWMSEIHFRSHFLAAILDVRKSISIAFLAISDRLAILGVRNSLSIAFLAISEWYGTFCCWNFWMRRQCQLSNSSEIWAISRERLHFTNTDKVPVFRVFINYMLVVCIPCHGYWYKLP